MAHVRESIAVVLTAVGLFGTSSCAGRATPGAGIVPLTNVRIFKAPKEEVWKAVVETVTAGELLPLEFSDGSTGRFATTLVRDVNARSRLSGTVLNVPDGVAVTLFNQVETFAGGRWGNVPTDYGLERRILESVAKKLGSP